MTRPAASSIWARVIGSMIEAAPDPASIVQRQLETYNARDLGGSMALFAEDVELFAFGSATAI